MRGGFTRVTETSVDLQLTVDREFKRSEVEYLLRHFRLSNTVGYGLAVFSTVSSATTSHVGDARCWQRQSAGTATLAAAGLALGLGIVEFQLLNDGQLDGKSGV